MTNKTYKVRIQTNYHIKKEKTCYGISIMLPTGTRYSKYPIGYQQIENLNEAQSIKQKIADFLNSDCDNKFCSTMIGPNKSQLVKLNMDL